MPDLKEFGSKILQAIGLKKKEEEQPKAGDVPAISAGDAWSLGQPARTETYDEVMEQQKAERIAHQQMVEERIAQGQRAEEKRAQQELAREQLVQKQKAERAALEQKLRTPPPPTPMYTPPPPKSVRPPPPSPQPKPKMRLPWQKPTPPPPVQPTSGDETPLVDMLKEKIGLW